MSLLLCSRKGDAFAWFAALLVLVFLPLASLSIDITRMAYVRNHVQTATDAACQSAADALDVPLFIQSSHKRIQPGLARSQAVREFSATLADASKVRFTIESLAIYFPSSTMAHCIVKASVQPLLPLTPAMLIEVETTSEMRAVSIQ